MLVKQNLIALKLDCCLGNTTVEAPAKLQSDALILKPKLVASCLHEFWR